MTAVRNGIHPLDESLDGSGMLRWILPSLEVAVRNVVALLPVVLIVCALVLSARWWIQWLPSSRSEMGGHVLQFCASAVMMTIAVFGYILLVQREGRPHGVGGVAPLSSVALRMLVVLAVWMLLTALLNWLVQAVLTSRPMQRPLLFLVSSIGPINAIMLLVWMMSPLFVFLAVLSTLSYVMCIRSELSISEVFSTVFARVFEQSSRLLLSGLVFSAMVLLIVRVLMETGFGWLAGIGQTGAYVVVCVVLSALCVWGLAWWFVLERAWLPECGVEDDLVAAVEPPQVAPSAGPQARGARPAPAPLSDAQTLELARLNMQLKLAEGDAAGAVDAFVEWLRGRQRSVNDLTALLDLLQSSWTALAAPLSAVTAELARNNRSFEAVELTRHGLARDPAFMADQPDSVPNWAKRLVQLEHPELAIRLLATYVRQHRAHPAYLGGGLLLARLLISHANQPEAARKLLEMLKTHYPQELQIEQLLRQLGPAP